jgi:hypothetical protein
LIDQFIPSPKLKAKIADFCKESSKVLEGYLRQNHPQEDILELTAECLSVLCSEAGLEPALRVLGLVEGETVGKLTGKMWGLVPEQMLFDLMNQTARELPSHALSLSALIILKTSNETAFEEAFRCLTDLLKQAALGHEAIDLAEEVSVRLSSTQLRQMNAALGACPRKGGHRLDGLRLKEAYALLREGEVETAICLVKTLSISPRLEVEVLRFYDEAGLSEVRRRQGVRKRPFNGPRQMRGKQMNESSATSIRERRVHSPSKSLTTWSYDFPGFEPRRLRSYTSTHPVDAGTIHSPPKTPSPSDYITEPSTINSASLVDEVPSHPCAEITLVNWHFSLSQRLVNSLSSCRLKRGIEGLFAVSCTSLRPYVYNSKGWSALYEGNDEEAVSEIALLGTLKEDVLGVTNHLESAAPFIENGTDLNWLTCFAIFNEGSIAKSKKLEDTLLRDLDSEQKKRWNSVKSNEYYAAFLTSCPSQEFEHLVAFKKFPRERNIKYMLATKQLVKTYSRDEEGDFMRDVQQSNGLKRAIDIVNDDTYSLHRERPGAKRGSNQVSIIVDHFQESSERLTQGKDETNCYEIAMSHAVYRLDKPHEKVHFSRHYTSTLEEHGIHFKKVTINKLFANAKKRKTLVGRLVTFCKGERLPCKEFIVKSRSNERVGGRFLFHFNFADLVEGELRIWNTWNKGFARVHNTRTHLFLLEGDCYNPRVAWRIWEVMVIYRRVLGGRKEE